MGSTEMSAANSSGKTEPESGYSAPARPTNFFALDFALRLILFGATLSGLVVLVTSKDTQLIPTGLPPPFPTVISRAAEFKNSPALIYQLVALSVTCLYSLITIITSATVISHPSPSPKRLFVLILWDALMAVILAAATGAAGGVAYIGLKGNSHIGWVKICGIYGKFCRHVGSSVAVSLVGSIALVMLVVLSAFSLYRRSR